MVARKLGLDIGLKTCGVAVSDPLGITAQSVTTLRFESGDWDAMVLLLEPLINEYDPDTIVIGYPTYPSGDKSKTTYAIEEAARILAEKFLIKQVFISENFSTKIVETRLGQAGASIKKRKEVKDQLAAQEILSDYLARL